MQHAHQPADLRAAIEAAIEAQEPFRARDLLGQLWQERPGPALAGYVKGRIDRIKAGLGLTPLKVAILRSYTLEPLVPLLQAAGALGGLDLSIQVGDFNTYAQDILNPQSNLYEFAPQAVILAVQTRDIAPELWDRFADLGPAEVQAVIERVLGEFSMLVGALRARSQAHLIIHGLEQAPGPSAGALDAQLVTGQAEAIRQINRALAELARQQSGVYLLDYDELIARCGRAAWYDERKWQTMRMPIRAEWLGRLTQEWLRFLHPISGRVAKCLVVDLDNTLWGGVIGEDGREGVKVGADYPGSAYLALQRVALDLYQRGIILAINSKNNLADAMEVLEQHPAMLLRPAHFAAMRINWQNKAENLREIAQELNIGVDSLVFIDDNPAECALVRSQLPEVTVIQLPADRPEAYAGLLRDCPLFERLTLSAEDKERGRYYAEQRQRSELEQQSGSLEGFLSSLKTSVVIEPVSPATLARTAQLTQKTNQFNMTTRRYSEQEIARLAADARWRIYTVRAADRFGDHGLIGVAMLQRQGQAWEIDTLLLSCRVIGRTVETAILATVAELARADGALALRGRFIPTKKNAPAREVYAAHGFRIVEQHEGATLWTFDLQNATIERPSWINCQLLEEVTP